MYSKEANDPSIVCSALLMKKVGGKVFYIKGRREWLKMERKKDK